MKKCFINLVEPNFKIAIINGPNINKIGTREKNIYGDKSFDDFYKQLIQKHQTISFNHFQSNIEGELVTKIQDYGLTCNGIILNAAAYTHTSVAIRDAISTISIPVIEVHISNIFAREEFRHTSLIAPVCLGSISGFGLKSYELAVQALIKH
jgi:3-dehydroquinate dehydratase-2